MIFVNSKSKHTVTRRVFGVDKHVRRSHVITEHLERTSVIDAVLWDELLEPVTGDEALPNVGLIVDEIPLDFKVEEVPRRKGLKEVTRTIKRRRGKFDLIPGNLCCSQARSYCMSRAHQ